MYVYNFADWSNIMDDVSTYIYNMYITVILEKQKVIGSLLNILQP